MANDIYTTKDTAQVLGVTPRTIQLWCESGVLESWKTPGGHRRFDRQVVEAFAKDRQITKKSVDAEVIEDSESCRVLIIEDDPMLLNLYNMNINSWELPIKLALSQDGYDGLVKIGLIQPHILILDLSLPSVDGFQIIATLLKNNLLSSMRVIVVSGLAKADIDQNIENIKNIRHLQKPVDFKIIREEIQNRLESNFKKMDMIG
ncbi:Excisionase/Xis, DNA-binding protein [Methylophaga frappieri]|uniref:Excisionase/Xis, DNA-binding protein n=1 Tax=Methylophaga frappieri (strain ATCC BAA-2434 / DSM 25690 / JAM7) TaxID=754477 RepID=I1YEA8_METFJ|nr:response regulator [Methylophaga frappieri]AFJ01251.1 Excisionase/Xis, DNA-binding protein [Methylophaga frappieri]